MRRWMIALVLVLAACGGAEPTAPVASNPTPQPTATPDCKTTATTYKSAVSNLLIEWDDSVKLADKTARINLTPQIESLQAIRRRFNEIARPDCADVAHQHLMTSLESTIDGYLAFLADESTSTTMEYFSTSAYEMKLYENAIDSAIAGVPFVEPTPAGINPLKLEAILWQQEDITDYKIATEASSLVSKIEGQTAFAGQVFYKDGDTVGQTSIHLFPSHADAVKALEDMAEKSDGTKMAMITDMGDPAYLLPNSASKYDDKIGLVRCNALIKVAFDSIADVSVLDYIQVIESRILVAGCQ